MSNDVTFKEFIQLHLKRKITTTRQEGVGWEEGTWAPPFYLKQPVTNVQRDHGLKEKKKVLNYHIFHCQVIRDYKRFKAGMGQAALCLFMAFFILFSPIFAGNCSTQESSNPSLINISYNLLVILLIVHKQAI